MRIARPEKGSAVCSVVSHAGPCYLADAVLTALETAGVAPRAKDPRASLAGGPVPGNGGRISRPTPGFPSRGPHPPSSSASEAPCLGDLIFVPQGVAIISATIAPTKP